MSAAGAQRHHGVAERFSHLLRSLNLSREEFLERIDHAVTDSSFFSIANGHRKPSRALAVLIERTWGFRAAYLLEGEGEPWVDAQPGADAGLSADEQEIVDFMRASTANAEEIRRSKDQREIWSRLARRNQRATAQLRQHGQTGEGPDREQYPLLCQLTFTESHRVAEHFKRYLDLHHERRIHRLNTLFVSQFLDEIPRVHLDATERKALNRIMKPLLSARRKQLEDIDAAIGRARETLLGICDMELPADYLSRTTDMPTATTTPEQQLRGLVEEIESGAHGDEARKLGGRLRATLEAMSEPGAQTFAHLMRRVTRRILEQLEPGASTPPVTDAEEMEARYALSIRTLLR